MVLFLVLRCFSFSKEITAGDSYRFLLPIPIFASWTIQVLDLTLNVTTVQVVETSVTNNSLSQDYLHPDDHAKEITDTLRFKPFTYRNTSYIRIRISQMFPRHGDQRDYSEGEMDIALYPRFASYCEYRISSIYYMAKTFQIWKKLQAKFIEPINTQYALTFTTKCTQRMHCYSPQFPSIWKSWMEQITPSRTE